MARIIEDADLGIIRMPDYGSGETIRVIPPDVDPWTPDPPPLGLESLDGFWQEEIGPDIPDEVLIEWENVASEADAGRDTRALQGSGFDFASYQNEAAECRVPSRHPAPGTLVGFPYSGTHTLGNWQSDNAVDIWLFPGTRVFAHSSGVISNRYGFSTTRQPGSSRFGGMRLHIEHPSGMVSFYQHMYAFTVRRGQKVNAGEHIGWSYFGNCAPHIHFAVSRPFRPQAFAARTWNRGARRPVTPTTEPTRDRDPEPDPEFPHRRTLEKAWLDFQQSRYRAKNARVRELKAYRDRLKAISR